MNPILMSTSRIDDCNIFRCLNPFQKSCFRQWLIFFSSLRGFFFSLTSFSLKTSAIRMWPTCSSFSLNTFALPDSSFDSGSGTAVSVSVIFVEVADLSDLGFLLAAVLCLFFCFLGLDWVPPSTGSPIFSLPSFDFTRLGRLLELDFPSKRRHLGLGLIGFGGPYHYQPLTFKLHHVLILHRIGTRDFR